MMILVILTTLLPAVCCIPIDVEPLGYYGGDSSKVSISGFSSGACFATQFHVAYSSDVMGVGILSGVPYYCAKLSFEDAERCMDSPVTIDTDYLVQFTENTAATTTNIDDVSHMNNDRVFIYGGEADSIILQESVKTVEDYYSAFGANIATKYDLLAEHALPTDMYGYSCLSVRTPYINDCDYNVAYSALNHIYGGLTKPGNTTALLGDFKTFDQQELFSALYSTDIETASMDLLGYVYVPSGCNTRYSGCKVHVTLHGCLQGRRYLGDVYARNTGYNEVAELNDIIIIYPQAIPKPAIGNRYGCWDWWGFTGSDYATKLAPQMRVIHEMINRVLA